MSAPKTNAKWGFGGKVESTYGTKVATTTTDGIFTIEPPEVEQPQYVNDGGRGNAPSGAKRQNYSTSGRFGSMKIATEGIGGGAAYSASIKPYVDLLLRTSGMSSTGSFTGGSEKYTYKPFTGPSGLESATYVAHLAGQNYTQYGCYSSFEITADGPGAPRWDFDIMGVADLPIDEAIPAYTTYPAVANGAAKAESIAFTLGLFTAAKVRSFHFTANRAHDAARLDINAATAHAGFTPGERDPILEVVIERCAVTTTSPWSAASTLNPYGMMEDKNLVICSLAVGSVQYKRWKLFAGNPASAAQAQVMSVKDGFDGPTATWTIQIGFRPSTYALEDDYSIVFD